MNKIQRVSLCFRYLFQIIFILLPLTQIIGWIAAPNSLHFLGITFDVIPKGYQHFIPNELSANVKLLAFMMSMIPTAVQLFVLYFLIKLFNHYEQKEIFSLQNVRYIRNVSYGILLQQCINPLCQFILGIPLTWQNATGHHMAVITISDTNVGLVLTAFIIILVSWIMAEGYRLREEQQLTI